MKSLTARLLALSLLLGAGAPALADWSYEDGLNFEASDFRLNVKNRTQVRLSAKDPDLFGESSQSFDIHLYKLTLAGELFKNWEFRLQANLADGSESSVKMLEDAYFVYKRKRMAQLWLGQGKVFFGRQDLTSTGNLQFADRSMAAMEFRHNPPDRSGSRDVGIALIGENERRTYSYQLGVYNGNGINKDEKDNDHYMALARLVVTPLGEYELGETDLSRPEDARLAVGVSVMTLTRGTDPIPEKTRDLVGNFEFAYKLRGVNMVGEFFTRSERPPLAAPLDEVDIDGWYFQIGYLFKSRNEIAGRYSEVLPDAPASDKQEYGLAWNYYFRDHDLKIQSDLRTLRYDADPVVDGCGSECDDTNVLRVQLQFAF